MSSLGWIASGRSACPPSREGTCWQHIVQTLVCYRLIDPGSEWAERLPGRVAGRLQLLADRTVFLPGSSAPMPV